MEITNDQLIAHLKTKTVHKLFELSLNFQISVRTVQRKIQVLDILKSYNCNNQYFTLSENARFDTNGIWRYNDICFSKFGSLKNTYIAVIQHSECGMNASEIEEVLSMRTRSFLSHFKTLHEVRREKIQGVYVYFSSVPDRFDIQHRKRMELADSKQITGKVTNAVAIEILVSTIKKPEYSIEKLCAHLHEKGINTSVGTIKKFFSYHGIEKKTTFDS